mgnify:FL=1
MWTVLDFQLAFPNTREFWTRGFENLLETPDPRKVRLVTTEGPPFRLLECVEIA